MISAGRMPWVYRTDRYWRTLPAVLKNSHGGKVVKSSPLGDGVGSSSPHFFQCVCAGNGGLILSDGGCGETLLEV